MELEKAHLDEDVLRGVQVLKHACEKWIERPGHNEVRDLIEALQPFQEKPEREVEPHPLLKDLIMEARVRASVDDDDGNESAPMRYRSREEWAGLITGFLGRYLEGADDAVISVAALALHARAQSIGSCLWHA